MSRKIGVWRAIGVGIAGIGLLPGCDQSPTPPAAPTVSATSPSNAASDSTKPTTQELLNGPYRKLALPGAPLALSIPPQWKIEMHTGGLTFLEGPTLADQVAIQLSARDALPKDRYDALIQRLSADDSASQPPGTPKKFEVRDVGMMKVVERMSTGSPIQTVRVGARGLPEVDAQGNQIVDTATPMRWLITVFIPDGKMMSHYELNFIGLTAEQYAVDKSLLEKVVASLKYEDGTLAPQIPGL